MEGDAVCAHVECDPRAGPATAAGCHVTLPSLVKIGQDLCALGTSIAWRDEEAPATMSEPFG